MKLLLRVRRINVKIDESEAIGAFSPELEKSAKPEDLQIVED
jgi:hypothetical protein